jgi:hypothetical protein
MCGPLPPGFTPPGAPVRTTPSAGLSGRRGELKLNVIRETIYRRLTRQRHARLRLGYTILGNREIRKTFTI